METLKHIVHRCPLTEVIVMVYKIGGTADQEAAEYIREHVTKPVVGYVVGISAPPGKTTAHAGAIITGAAGLRRRRSRRWSVRGLWWQGVLVCSLLTWDHILNK